jgi:hypothetical protein
MSDDCVNYHFHLKEHARGLATITATQILDMSVVYRTPRKPWSEHMGLLLLTPNIDHDQLEQADEFFTTNRFMNQPFVWCLTSADLKRLDLKRIALNEA